MDPHEVQRLSEPIGRPRSPSIFVNISPTTSQKNTNNASQEGTLAFLAGVVVGLALALTYKGGRNDD
jgi:hypothetical protein